jgi:formylglycine-generating enzyme required for sulfatase activity
MQAAKQERRYEVFISYRRGAADELALLLQTLSVDPTGPKSGEYRVLRGGSWFNRSMNLRSSLRHYLDPGDTNNVIGFRCAREVLP